MRRELFRMERGSALQLLGRAEVVRLATTRPDGEPVLRVVHGVVRGEALYFHGSPVGEKTEALGRRVVLSAEELVAEIPSWFSDPERACPATTLYESVQVHGVLEEVTDADEKAGALQALMERFQPEGRHVPITAEHPLYQARLRGLGITRVSLAELDGKSKLGQNKRPEELTALLEQLWRRGRPADLRAIEKIRAANPAVPEPAFLRAPAGVRLQVAAGAVEAAEAAALLEGSYWNLGIPRAQLAAAQLASSAWVVAKDEAGCVVGTARALADGVKNAWLYDVLVAPARRGRGLGQALVGLVLDHPAVRSARTVRLGTRDALSLYRRFGFVESGTGPRGNPEMLLQR